MRRKLRNGCDFVSIPASDRMVTDGNGDDDAGTDNSPQREAGKTGREGAICEIGGEDAREEGREAQAP